MTGIWWCRYMFFAHFHEAGGWILVAIPYPASCPCTWSQAMCLAGLSALGHTCPTGQLCSVLKSEVHCRAWLSLRSWWTCQWPTRKGESPLVVLYHSTKLEWPASWNLVKRSPQSIRAYLACSLVAISTPRPLYTVFLHPYTFLGSKGIKRTINLSHYSIMLSGPFSMLMCLWQRKQWEPSYSLKESSYKMRKTLEALV